MITIKAPATSANMGPGFDCMGIALDLYNTVMIEETASGLEIEILDESRRYLPTDSRNSVYDAMERVFKKVGKRPDGLKITLDNAIPVTRGLGSSAASIVAGLVGANALTGNELSVSQLLSMAANIEGHPDNVTPSLLGGYAISLMSNNKIKYSRNEIDDKFKFAAIVPDFYLSTKKSRAILPKYTSYKNASYNISHASLLSASLINGDSDGVRAAMKDKLHQHYRLSYIKGGHWIMKSAMEFGAAATYVSGAGPTIMAVLDGNYDEFYEKMNLYLNQRFNGWKVKIYNVSNTGVVVTNS